MKIAYTGISDFQEFDKTDFAKAGIEDGPKLRFAQGEPTEVDDALGEVLVAKDGIFGDFAFVNLDEVEVDADTDEEEDELLSAEADKAVRRTAKKAASSSDTGGPSTSGKSAKAQSAGGTSTAGASTGKGTSTGGTSSSSTR